MKPDEDEQTFGSADDQSQLRTDWHTHHLMIVTCEDRSGSWIVTWKHTVPYSSTQKQKLLHILSQVISEQIRSAVTTATQLTVVWVVSYDVVSSAPVPQKKSGISGARHNVAVPSDVGLWPSQTRHHVPVAKNDLGQLSCIGETSPLDNKVQLEYKIHLQRTIKNMWNTTNQFQWNILGSSCPRSHRPGCSGCRLSPRSSVCWSGCSGPPGLWSDAYSHLSCSLHWSQEMFQELIGAKRKMNLVCGPEVCSLTNERVHLNGQMMSLLQGVSWSSTKAWEVYK